MAYDDLVRDSLLAVDTHVSQQDDPLVKAAWDVLKQLITNLLNHPVSPGVRRY